MQLCSWSALLEQCLHTFWLWLTLLHFTKPPTRRRPKPSYEGHYNFFDPDNFLSVSALVHSGVEYLQREARLLLERTVKDVREDGLMPHHIDEQKDGMRAHNIW